MKKRYWLLLFAAAFGIIFWVLLKDADAPVTTTPGNDTLNPEPAPAQKDDMIILESPLPGAQVSSPLVIKGKARGNWFFEASFPVVLTDWDGKIIAEGHADALGEWMTTEYVPFTATLNYTLPAGTPYRRGFLILKKDNPSGEPQFDNALEVMINL